MLSGTVKFKQVRQYVAVGLVALGVAGCASLPNRAGETPASSPQPLARMTVATPDLDHDLLAQLMAGELALSSADLKAASQAYGKAMRISNDPEVAGKATALAIAIHDPNAANQAIGRWQALGASPAQLAQARAELAVEQGQTEEAKRQLSLLLASGDKDAWRMFGRVLIGSRDAALASSLLQSLATPDRLPPDPKAWLAMSELGEQLGRHAYAQQLADGAMKRFGTAETYAWAAQLKLNNGDRTGGLNLLKQAQVKDPTNIGLRLTYASVLGQSGDYAQAAKMLEKGPQNAQTYAMRAALAASAKDNKSLEQVYKQLSQAPDNVRTASAYLLGQLAEVLGRKEEALKWYDQVPDDDDHAFDADLRTAILLQDLGRSAEAHQQLAEMQTDYLDQPAQLRRAYEVDADLYLREKRYTEATDAFSHALQVVPDDPDLLYGRGLAYAEIGKIDQAVADFRRLLQIKPDDIDASNALGFTLADAGRDLPEAEKLIAAARAAKPDDPSIADSWGWLQYRLGHLDQAAQVLRGAWQNGKDADVGVHLGEVLWKQGHHEQAQQVFDEVRRMDPHNSTLQQTLKRLEP
ncbi:tetratricopeptide repeat protein [Dyella caseinilytica]|uniref:tetratricopeptide repeat protein n=1 Tax=Dyella caseinilytica TaxID=1849581 RepID=UPI0019B18E58|nr:tetratricopeptide repeat protein [Dyella caseinilytica]GGA07813.1 membrane protein [Dyella caseinilytica]